MFLVPAQSAAAGVDLAHRRDRKRFARTCGTTRVGFVALRRSWSPVLQPVRSRFGCWRVESVEGGADGVDDGRFGWEGGLFGGGKFAVAVAGDGHR